MAEFRWIKMSLFLILVLQFTDENAGNSASTTNPKATSIKERTSEGTNNTNSTDKENQTGQGSLWWYVVVAVGLAALLITVAVLIRWKKTKGNKTQTDENLADPEDGVFYASISLTKNSNSKVKVQSDDEDDTVTYSTVQAVSSSAGASADPSHLYATVNKPKK